MRVLLFGATGMVGQGVLRECLLDSSVDEVIAIGRNSIPQQSPKLRQILRADVRDLSGLDKELAAIDACFFCLGVSSVGMTEQAYRTVTFELTTVIAGRLAALNPSLVFAYVSGAGTDSSERGRSMWARIKGQTENALLRLPFKAAYMFRPAIIVPLHGMQSKTALYRWLYRALTPLLPFLERTFPKYVTTTERWDKPCCGSRVREPPSASWRTAISIYWVNESRAIPVV